MWKRFMIKAKENKNTPTCQEDVKAQTIPITERCTVSGLACLKSAGQTSQTWAEWKPWPESELWVTTMLILLVLWGSLELSKHTKDRLHQEDGKISDEMFSQDDWEKVKAKARGVNTKTVHANYFPKGVSTLFPLCSSAGEPSHFLSQGTLSIPFPFWFTVNVQNRLVFYLNVKHDTIQSEHCMYEATPKMLSTDTNQEQCTCRRALTPCLKQSDYIDVFIYWMCSGLS